MCGYDKCIKALQCHHRDPKQKEFGIGYNSRIAWDKLVKELDKCDYLCANCHFEIEHKIYMKKLHSSKIAQEADSG